MTTEKKNHTHKHGVEKHECKCKNNGNYAFYSRILKQPFDSVEDLMSAEAAYQAEIKAKEDNAAAKKADAKVVEDAFKKLNQARKAYKEDLLHMTEAYQKALAMLKSDFEEDKQKVQKALAQAEEDYSKALKSFTEKYDRYHLTLKDGDFETTISSQTTGNVKKADNSLMNLFDLLFSF